MIMIHTGRRDIQLEVGVVPTRLQSDLTSSTMGLLPIFKSLPDLFSIIFVSSPSIEPSNYCNISRAREVGERTRTRMSIIHGKVLG